MHLQTNTTEGWSGVIADLTTRQKTAKDHVERLQTERQRLALEAAMGGTDAKKRLAAINQELEKAARDGDDFDSAIKQASSAKQQAAVTEAEAAEHDRRVKISVSMRRYRDQVVKIDAGLAALVEHFGAATQCLDEAEALMTSREAEPLRQLRSAFAPTLAAAHAGLGRYIELGHAAQHIQHRKTFTAYAAIFIDGWVNNPEESNGE